MDKADQAVERGKNNKNRRSYHSLYQEIKIPRDYGGYDGHRTIRTNMTLIDLAHVSFLMLEISEKFCKMKKTGFCCYQIEKNGT